MFAGFAGEHASGLAIHKLAAKALALEFFAHFDALGSIKRPRFFHGLSTLGFPLADPLASTFVCARTDGGSVVEGVEISDHLFFVGPQSHPEISNHAGTRLRPDGHKNGKPYGHLISVPMGQCA